MTLLKPAIEPVPSRLGLLAAWLPRIAVAIVFLSVGSAKFRDPMWVRLFGEIGLGQWFRCLTGVMQIAGGVLVLIPRVSLAGIALAACTCSARRSRGSRSCMRRGTRPSPRRCSQS